MLHKELIYAALGTGATCLATVLGAALVFFFKKEMSHLTQKVFLGFAAGVMVAASVWSLLIPAMDMAREGGGAVLLPVAGGFVVGGAFLLVLDGLLPHLHGGAFFVCLPPTIEKRPAPFTVQGALCSVFTVLQQRP